MKVGLQVILAYCKNTCSIFIENILNPNPDWAMVLCVYRVSQMFGSAKAAEKNLAKPARNIVLGGLLNGGIENPLRLSKFL